MHQMTRRALAGTGLALVLAASMALAQQPQTVRVRGQIEKVDGTTLTVKARDGSELKVKLADPPRINAMVKSSLADIKEGSFIGVSAMPQPDGTQKAFAIHIFLDAQRGVVADRFGDWDSRPGSTMTNANVATMVTGKDGNFTIENLPPGKYTLAAWHEVFGELTQELNVENSAKAELKFAFTQATAETPH